MTELPLTIPDLLTLTGLTGLLYMLLSVVHSVQLLPSRRFLPLLAMGLGSGIAAVAASVTGSNVPDAVLLGVVSGMLSSGVEETRKGVAEATSKVRDVRINRRIEREIESMNADIEEMLGDDDAQATATLAGPVFGDGPVSRFEEEPDDDDDLTGAS